MVTFDFIYIVVHLYSWLFRLFYLFCEFFNHYAIHVSIHCILCRKRVLMKSGLPRLSIICCDSHHNLCFISDTTTEGSGLVPVSVAVWKYNLVVSLLITLELGSKVSADYNDGKIMHFRWHLFNSVFLGAGPDISVVMWLPRWIILSNEQETKVEWLFNVNKIPRRIRFGSQNTRDHCKITYSLS